MHSLKFKKWEVSFEPKENGVQVTMPDGKKQRMRTDTARWVWLMLAKSGWEKK